MKVENMETTITNSYQIQDDGANTSQELYINNINHNLIVDGDDKTYLVEEIYPPFIAKFMKHIGGMISLGKNGKTIAINWSISVKITCS